jgi:hypothetical protein
MKALRRRPAGRHLDNVGGPSPVPRVRLHREWFAVRRFISEGRFEGIVVLFYSAIIEPFAAVVLNDVKEDLE